GPTLPGRLRAAAAPHGAAAVAAGTVRSASMSTVFTKIINGELPGRFVWKDDRAVAFLSINPLGPGHTLVVPREEVDHWVDADADLISHLSQVAHTVGRAVREVWQPPRVGVIIAGFEV